MSRRFVYTIAAPHLCDESGRIGHRPDDTLAAMLGHSRIQMVLRYAHPTQEHQTKAMNKMEQFVAEQRIASQNEMRRLSHKLFSDSPQIWVGHYISHYSAEITKAPQGAKLLNNLEARVGIEPRRHIDRE
jgi:hypothetical protein